MIDKIINQQNGFISGNEKLAINAKLSLAVNDQYHGISFDKQFECNPHNVTCPTRQ